MTIKNVTTSGPANGSLLIHGGGDIDNDQFFKSTFLNLAGGPEAPMVYIPTAFSNEQLKHQHKNHMDPGFASKRFGFSQATILHTRDPNKANTESFVEPVLRARAVFFAGGRPWRLADSYLDTRTHQELKNLLQRGGVIAGSSAGATIQGSFLVRGSSDPNDNRILIGDHEVGFGFISNVAIDPHLLQFNRQFHMFEVIDKHPELLGIGIDIDTSIFVQGKDFTVIGRSYVAVYDRTFLSTDGSTFHELPPESERFYLLRRGNRYDMKNRKLIL